MPTDTMQINPEDFAKRLHKALGDGYEKTFSEAINVSPSTVYRWCAGTVPVPQYAVAILEFLEILPMGFWPARWTDRG